MTKSETPDWPYGLVGGYQAAVNQAKKRFDAVVAERDVLAAIVRDLATARGVVGVAALADATDRCHLCGGVAAFPDDPHLDSCVVLRAREWVAAQETNQ